MIGLRLESASRGAHVLDCALALSGPGGHESDLPNNAARGPLVVRGSEADWDYDVELTGIDAATHPTLVPGEHRRQSGAANNVRHARVETTP